LERAAASSQGWAGDMDVDVQRLRNGVTRQNRYHTRIALLAHLVQHAPEDTRLQVLLPSLGPGFAGTPDFVRFPPAG
jgi:hypothetical protein